MKISNRFYYFLSGAIILVLLAIGTEKYFNPNRLLQKYTRIIEADLQDKEQLVVRFLSDRSFISDQFHEKDADITTIRSLAENRFNICLYKADSLIFWSNSLTFPTPTLLSKLKTTSQPIFQRSTNGFFVFQKHNLSTDRDPNEIAVSIIPIKWDYRTNFSFLKTNFEAGNTTKIPAQIEISLSPTPYPVQSNNGDTLFFLKQTDDFQDQAILKWVLLMYLFSFVLFGVVLNKIAQNLMKWGKPWMGPTFLLVFVFGLRYLTLDWSLKFQSFQVFSRTFDNPHVSVGDLLINIVLLLWAVIFIHRESGDREFKANFSNSTRFFLTAMNYLSVVLALLLLISVLKSLVLNSGIDFDFKNVFSLDQYSVFAVFGIILLLLTQFVFSHRMMITTHKLKLDRKQRFFALTLAILMALPIIHFIDLQLPLLYTALIAFVFVLTYDLFINIPNPGLVWLVGWVILFAGFSSSLLYEYNKEKENSEEIHLARVLSEERDSLAEAAIIAFKAELDLLAPDLIFTTDSLMGRGNRKGLFESIIFKQNYLYTNYNYQTYFYDEPGRLKGVAPAKINLVDWQEKYTQAQPLEKHANIFFSVDEKKKNSYLYLKKFPQYATASKVPQLIVEFKKAPRKRAKVYTNLLFRTEYKGLKDLANYDYAIIKDGYPIVEQGITADDPYFETNPDIGGHAKASSGDLVYFMYRFGEKDYVILSKPRNNLFHPISLFSFIFGFLALMVLIFALLNSYLNILPDNFNFQFWNKPSLKNRIQFSTILLTLASFLIIGIVSVYFLTNSYISYDKSRLSRKVSGVQTSAEQYLHLEQDDIIRLKTHIGELAEAQRIDVNLFNLDGSLIQSSEMDIFSRGILPPKMNAYAYKYLQSTKKSELVQIQESISDQHFISAYTDIRDSKGQKVAYLGVPYANQQRNLKDDVLNFLGNLLNVYVFMLIIAGGISVSVANTITKPISTIGENLKELKLGKPNEPLEWRTNDEIGALIEEYNRMILKLEHSAKLLARSEREGAWREMAKQVAHEIKNPLTPMKLSIQYLQHAFKSNPNNIEPLLQRVSNTLIEQIDSLAQIASEFSNFAKMPRANNQQIRLNDLVESAHDLFKKSKNIDVLLNLPTEDFYVFADKNHLMRVLNNMIKNAVEAIPDTRKGKIDVSLYKSEQMAVIKVADNGVGIPENMQTKVFVPNFTTKNSGTGLGLAISKNIIESVNGKIYFETELEVGTTFFVELPLEEMVV